MAEKTLRNLADDVVSGASRRAIEACRADPRLAGELSMAVAEQLVERAASHAPGGDAPLFVWPGAQDAIVALAASPGADAKALAGALLRCCLHEGVSGEPDQLGETGLRLIVDHHQEVLERLIRPQPCELEDDDLFPPWPKPAWADTRFLADALWTLPGAEGARWMDRLLDCDPWAIVSRRPRTWTAEDWALRLDVLSDRAEIPGEAYAVEGRMLDSDDPAPRAAGPALARYACSRFTEGQDPRRYLGRAADVLALHRSGDPGVDVGLFWWGATTTDEVTALRWLLELAGPAGARAPLVEVAAARGLVADGIARELTVDLERPLWADRDAPWVVTEVREEGILDVPDALAGLLGAERLWTRTVIAVHPVGGRTEAAIEVLAQPGAHPLRWEIAGDGLWLGCGEDGTVARAVRDLGVLDLDLEAEQPPWFLHDRVPPVEDGDVELPATINAAALKGLALAGAPLHHQRHALREALRRRGVGEYASAVVLRHVRDGVALVAADAPRRSRIGGPARLPVGTPWPALSEERGSYLPLLAEFALAELPAVAPLPSDGTLLVFQETETWSSETEPEAGTRVFYVPEGEDVHEASPPGRLVFPLEERALRGIAVPIPGESELVVAALEFVDDRERTIEAVNELLDDWWPAHWLLGVAGDIQGPSRLEVPYWLEQSSVETRARFTAEELAGRGWTLLAQINEDAAADLIIGDGGSFYLYILERDLRERRFDRVVGFMQCH